MINNVHNESLIGIKKLSDAELGKKRTSNQTHIGLFANTLKFIDNDHEIILSQLLYNDQSIELISLLDYIENPDGTFRSPKIRAGQDSQLNFNGNRINSVVREIREIAIDSNDIEWYLLWFGQNNKELVFYLFNNLAFTEDKEDIENIIGSIGNKRTVRQGDPFYSALVHYLNSKFEKLNIEYFKDLEDAAFAGQTQVKSRLRTPPKDLEKANKRAAEIGKKGEKILNNFFESEKSKNRIKDFIWKNAVKESGEAYDFKITLNDDQNIFVDAKSTCYEFNRPIHISSSELNFIYQHKENYHIYRLYFIEESPKLRICKNIFKVADIFKPHYERFEASIKHEEKNLNISGTSLSVPVGLDCVSFAKSIELKEI